MALDLELAQLALRNVAKPHWLCKDVRGDLFEFISYPYIDGGHVCVKARVPGDPTSIFTADALLLDPEGKQCMCAEAGKDFYLKPEYYREREARLMDSPAFLWKEEPLPAGSVADPKLADGSVTSRQEPLKTATVLTAADRESVLKIISGARHEYSTRLIHAKTTQERDFYAARLDEADRLAAIFKSKDALVVEDEDDEAEYRAEMEEE